MQTLVAMTDTIRHNEADGRFEMDVKGGTAYTHYLRSGDRIIFTHTEVPPPAEGQGVGNALARAALDYSRSQHLRVGVRCPFIAAWIKRHPEYQDLLDKNENG